MSQAKFVVGMDLGTTNSVVAYAPLDTERPGVEVLAIPQLVAAKTMEARPHLPLIYVFGHRARKGGRRVRRGMASRARFRRGRSGPAAIGRSTDRTVGAAKSWLCHSKVDRHQAILPWGAPKEFGKVSPVTASRRYLEHLVAAWHEAFPDAPIADQVVVLTVPASFDVAARELTREAAPSRPGCQNR